MGRFVSKGRGLIIAAACAALLGAGTAVAAHSASAETTSGGWTGVYPVGTVCARDAQTIYVAYLKARSGADAGKRVGRVELRYSVRCHTAWARMYNYRRYVPGDTHLSHGWIRRTTDGKTFRCTPPAGTNQYCVTKMVYDKSPRTAYARGWIDDYPNSYDQLRARTRAY